MPSFSSVHVSLCNRIQVSRFSTGLFLRAYCDRSKKNTILLTKTSQLMKSSHLRNCFLENLFVGLLCYFSVVVGWLQDKFNFLDNPILLLNFLQKLKKLKVRFVHQILNYYVNIVDHTFSLTAISTAEFGTSSIIFNLSSTTFILTCCLELCPEHINHARNSSMYFISFYLIQR